jgi:hypothetical protein
MDDHLGKPIRIDDLSKMLEKWAEPRVSSDPA